MRVEARRRQAVVTAHGPHRRSVVASRRVHAEGLAGRFAIPGGVIVAAAQAAEAGRMPDAPPTKATDLDFAVAAQLMRRIMVDHARQRHALKRGGAAQKVTLDETALVTETRAAELLALDEALENLAAFDPRMSKIVEMRYFGGLSNEEIAEVLKIHPNTVMRDWSAAKAWLYAALSGEEC